MSGSHRSYELHSVDISVTDTDLLQLGINGLGDNLENLAFCYCNFFSFRQLTNVQLNYLNTCMYFSYVLISYPLPLRLMNFCQEIDTINYIPPDRHAINIYIYIYNSFRISEENKRNCSPSKFCMHLFNITVLYGI